MQLFNKCESLLKPYICHHVSLVYLAHTRSLCHIFPGFHLYTIWKYAFKYFAVLIFFWDVLVRICIWWAKRSVAKLYTQSSWQIYIKGRNMRHIILPLYSLIFDFFLPCLCFKERLIVGLLCPIRITIFSFLSLLLLTPVFVKYLYLTAFNYDNKLI